MLAAVMQRCRPLLPPPPPTPPPPVPDLRRPLLLQLLRLADHVRFIVVHEAIVTVCPEHVASYWRRKQSTRMEAVLAPVQTRLHCAKTR